MLEHILARAYLTQTKHLYNMRKQLQEIQQAPKLFNLTNTFMTCSITYIDGCRSVGRINHSLVTPVNRQRQSDGY